MPDKSNSNPRNHELIGRGSFNFVLRDGNHVIKIPIPENESLRNKKWNVIEDLANHILHTTQPMQASILNINSQLDTAERSVRLWNEINPDYPAELHKNSHGAVFWKAPYISGTDSSESKIINKLIEVYRKHERIVVDALAMGNCITDESGKVHIVDIGQALKLHGGDHDNSNENDWETGSEASANYWEKMRKDAGHILNRQDLETNPVHTTIKALLVYHQMNIKDRSKYTLEKDHDRKKLAGIYKKNQPTFPSSLRNARREIRNLTQHTLTAYLQLTSTSRTINQETSNPIENIRNNLLKIKNKSQAKDIHIITEKSLNDSKAYQLVNTFNINLNKKNKLPRFFKNKDQKSQYQLVQTEMSNIKNDLIKLREKITNSNSLALIAGVLSTHRHRFHLPFQSTHSLQTLRESETSPSP